LPYENKNEEFQPENQPIYKGRICVPEVVAPIIMLGTNQLIQIMRFGKFFSHMYI
jgi:hypothetical protein